MAKLTSKPRGRAFVRVVGTVLTASTLLLGCDEDYTGTTDATPSDASVDTTEVDAREDAPTR